MVAAGISTGRPASALYAGRAEARSSVPDDLSPQKVEA